MYNHFIFLYKHFFNNFFFAKFQLIFRPMISLHYICYFYAAPLKNCFSKFTDKLIRKMKPETTYHSFETIPTILMTNRFDWVSCMQTSQRISFCIYQFQVKSHNFDFLMRLQNISFIPDLKDLILGENNRKPCACANQQSESNQQFDLTVRSNRNLGSSFRVLASKHET